MLKVARSVVALLLLSVFVAACNDDQGPKIPSMSGTWSGYIGGITFSLTLTEDKDRRVEGSGSVSASSTAIAFTVTGNHVHPNVTLTIKATGYYDLNFSGKYSGDNTIVGTLNGSGFVNEPLTFNRR